MTAADAPTLNILTRVYGQDYSSAVYWDVLTDSYRNFVQKFTENGSRHILDYTAASEGVNMYARNYIIQQLNELSSGRIETETIGNLLNVVGRLPGYLPGENPAFAISAHYDSAAGSPGANCDGSGIAAVLELARVLSKYEWPLDIYFIAFNGLFTQSFMDGSPQVANEFMQRELEFLMIYNVDTLLVQDPTVPVDERIQFGYAEGPYHNGQYWADLARQLSNNIGMNRIVPKPSSIFYLWELSDQYPFYQRGFNVMCAFESGLAYDGSYQNSNDRWNNRDYLYSLGRETTAVIGASIAYTMSRGLGQSVTSNHEFTLASGSIEQIYITVTTPTVVNVSARWYGGISSFYLFNPSGALISTREYNHTSAWEPMDVLNRPVTEIGQYTLIVYNSDFRVVGYEVNVSIDTDIENNGVLDSREYWIDSDLFNRDQDSDGLSDAEELLLGTDSNLVDSDNDAMPDKYEVDNGFDPRDPSDGNGDEDQDGLTNAQEYSGGLNPFSDDSDNDMMPDLWELENGLNPLVNDADLDLDQDGVSNLDEYLNDSDPQEPEPMEIPTELFVLPVILVAVTGAFVYILRRKDPWT
ncbi:MAG: M28 family peptidase [Candidatus Thorarchaeota archaeon]